MKEYRIAFNMYNMLKEEKDVTGPWKNFMTYVKDTNVDVIVVLAGKDHLRVKYDPGSPDEIKEVAIK